MSNNKGNDFENCIMYEAHSRLSALTVQTSNPYAAKYSSINKDVKNDTPKILDKIEQDLNITTNLSKQSFYQSFQKIAGKAKTDIMFTAGGKIYKCSLKWGNVFQLSSAGLETTDNFLTKVMQKIISNQGNNNTTTTTTIADVILIMSQIDGIIGEDKIQTASQLKPKLSKIRGSHNSLQSRLQSILGSARNPNVDDMYVNFKKETLREALTGELVFGSTSNFSANYILSGPLTNYSLVKIDDSYINSIMSKSSVRIASKGRGKSVGTGGKIIRLNEATIRLDVKE